MEKQDVKRMQIVRHLKQQNTATRTTKKRSTTYNTPVRHALYGILWKDHSYF